MSASTGFRIVVEDPFHFTRNLTGTIYLDLDGNGFPAQGWSDFVVIVLSWWVEEAIRLCPATAARGEWLFMDGPYLVAVTKSSGSWTMDLQRRTARGEIASEGTAVIDEKTVVRELIGAAETAAGLCRRNGWVTSDLENLEASLPVLREFDGRD